MVDLSACEATAAGSVTRSLWRLLWQLLQPGLVLPLLSLLTVAPWLRPGPWSRRLGWVGGLLLLVYGLGASPWGIQMGGAGLTRLIPEDGGQPADAIVVLGRGQEFRPGRVAVAAALWQRGRAPLVFASGRGDALELAQLLEQAGVPAAAIDGEPCSATTNENALFTAALLQPQGIRRLILVTDPPHMARSLLTFRSLGFDTIPQPSPVPSGIDLQRQRSLVLREWAGLIGYGLMGRYFARDFEPSGLRAEVGGGEGIVQSSKFKIQSSKF